MLKTILRNTPGFIVLASACSFLLISQAARAQDNFEWTFHQSNNPDNGGRMTSRLQRGVPETDNIQLTGICDAASGSSVRFSVLTLAADIGNLKKGTAVKLRFSGGGIERELPGEITRNDAEEGIAGVIVRPEHNDVLWSALTQKQALDYLIPGYRANTLTLGVGRSVIKQFINSCRAYERAVLPASSAGAGNADPNRISAKEAFQNAKDLGTTDAWEAFLEQFPTGFRAKLARAYIKKLSGGSAPATPATSATATAPASTPALPFLRILKGNNNWKTSRQHVEYDGGRKVHTASVKNKGVELLAYCHKYGRNKKLTLLIRRDPSNGSSNITRALNYATKTAPRFKAPTPFDNVRRITAKFDDGSSLPLATTYNNLGLGTEFKVLQNGQEIDYRSDALGELMSQDVFTVSAPSFSFSFQLDGSRKALCSVLNRCGAKRSDCNRESEEPSEPRCSGGRYYSKSRGACRCPRGRSFENGRCARNRSITKTRQCSGGRYYSKKRRTCVCPRGREFVGGKCRRNEELDNDNPCGPGFTQKRGKCVHNSRINSQPQVNVKQQNWQKACQKRAKSCDWNCNFKNISKDAIAACKVNCWQQCAAH